MSDDAKASQAPVADDGVTMRRRAATEDAANTVSMLERQLSQVQRLSQAAQDLQRNLQELRESQLGEDLGGSAKKQESEKLSQKQAPPAEQVEQLSVLFDQVDIDGSGEVCLEELRIVLTEKGYTDDFVEHLFCHLDSNKDASISRQEFSDAMKFIPQEIFTDQVVLTTNELLRYFDEFDVDKNGVVDLREFSDALRARGVRDETIRNYFKNLDLNNDGGITRAEYARCIGMRLD